ncbi:hypothetical protein BH11BAC2_BH11BAC2_13050 [soil metagenome]
MSTKVSAVAANSDPQNSYTANGKYLIQLEQVKINTKDSLLNLLATVSDNSLQSKNEKFMTQFYLNHIFQTQFIYSQPETDSLFYIANLCPYLGGKAVYKARAALRWVTDTLVYDDETTCLISSMRLKEEDNAGATVQLIGNPFSKNSMLQFSAALQEKGIVKVVSLQGEIIKEEIIPESTISLPLTGLNLPGGMYLIKIYTKITTFNTVKLVVQ